MSNFSYYQSDYLNFIREVTDPFADEVVKELFQKGFNPMVENSYSNFIYNHQEIPAEFPAVLKEYFSELEQIDGAFSKYIGPGSKVFQKHAPDLMAMLGVLSLPYCYASGHGVQVLYLSERIKNNPAKRLLETAAFVLDVCHPNAFDPEGKAFRSIAKVRLMHAAIRYHILHSNRWDSKWGIPINQEDMAGTNLSFSLIAIRGLRKLGHNISPGQAHDFIQLWNAIGYNLGVHRELLPENNREAFFLEKQISSRGFYPTEEGKTLTRTLINHMMSETKGKVPIEAVMHHLLGEEVADNLGVKENGKEKSLIWLVKIMNGLKSLKVDDNAYQKSLTSYETQRKKLENTGIQLKPFRMLKALRD